MKKNNDKKFSFQLKEWLFTGILGFLIFISSPQLMFAKDATSPPLCDEAIILFEIEVILSLEIEWFPKKFIPKKIGADLDKLFGVTINKSINTVRQ